jgi:dihydrofolate reductase
MTINAIVACDTKYGIGFLNDMPWPRSDADMKWFRENTIGHVVVMGSNTWRSIGCKKLPKRINYVITRNGVEGSPDGCHYGEMGIVLRSIQAQHPGLKIWVIGGSDLYRQSLPYCDNLYLTKFKKEYQCDTFLDPKWLQPFTKLTSDKNTEECTFSIWRKM